LCALSGLFFVFEKKSDNYILRFIQSSEAPKGTALEETVEIIVFSPAELWDMFREVTGVTSSFKTYVRSYNNAFAFTSMGVRCDRLLCRGDMGVYTFRVQGQVHHYVNSLSPVENQPTCLQLYFYDTENEVRNRILTSKIFSNKLCPEVVLQLMNILDANPFSRFFRTLQTMPNIEECRIVIKCNVDLDQRVFNAPTASQVAAIWVDDDSGLLPARDIVVYSHPGYSHSIKYYFGCYDPLSYPLLLPLGESGWHEGIKRRVSSRRQNVRNSVAPNVVNFESPESFLASEETGPKKKNLSIFFIIFCFFCG